MVPIPTLVVAAVVAVVVVAAAAVCGLPGWETGWLSDSVVAEDTDMEDEETSMGLMRDGGGGRGSRGGRGKSASSSSPSLSSLASSDVAVSAAAPPNPALPRDYYPLGDAKDVGGTDAGAGDGGVSTAVAPRCHTWLPCLRPTCARLD